MSIRLIQGSDDGERAFRCMLNELKVSSEYVSMDTKTLSKSEGIKVERVPLMAVDEWILPEGTDLLSAALIVWDKDYYNIA